LCKDAPTDGGLRSVDYMSHVYFTKNSGYYKLVLTSYCDHRRMTNSKLYSGKKYASTRLDESHVLKACKNEAKLMDETMAFAKSFNKTDQVSTLSRKSQMWRF
jgi:hypothetical protein